MNLKNFSPTRLISGGFCNFAKHGWICKLPVPILLRIQFQTGSILCKKSNFTLLSRHFQQNLFLEPSIRKLVKRSSVSQFWLTMHTMFTALALFCSNMNWPHEAMSSLRPVPNRAAKSIPTIISRIGRLAPRTNRPLRSSFDQKGASI